MSADLAAIFADLERRHVALASAPLPVARPGVEWIWAANGVFKRAMTPALEAMILVSRTVPVPGLATLTPYVRWSAVADRLPGHQLAWLLHDAQRAASDDAIAHPIEKQYFFVERGGVRVIAPRAQEATATRVRYAMPESGTVLLDLHSHHRMKAFFSSTDDRDDDGLSVSAVLGNIFDRPELSMRINVYGHHQLIPALLVFDSLPTELIDIYHTRGVHAITRH